MAVAQLNSTTLSEALTADASEVTLASTANISVGDIAVVSGEAMKVVEIPVAGRVKLQRGVSGTVVRPSPSGAIVYTGSPSAFKAIQQSANAVVGNSGVFPDYMLPGSRAIDSRGNEYILLDLTFSAFNGVAVLVSRDGAFTASALVAGLAGTVAILVEEGTSAQYAWGQIYGAKSYAQFTSGSSLATSTGIVQVASSASVPVGALLARTTSQASSEASAHIYGLYLTSAVTTATTAATSATGFQGSVWLNYPFTERQASS